jgi:hypothetical protein
MIQNACPNQLLYLLNAHKVPMKDSWVFPNPYCPQHISPNAHPHFLQKLLNLFWQDCVKPTVFEWESLLRASSGMLSMQSCRKISHIQALVINFFPTPPIKLKLRLKVCGRLIIATHLDQSNYLANEKQGGSQ